MPASSAECSVQAQEETRSGADGFVGLREACRLLNYSESGLLRLIHQKIVPAVVLKCKLAIPRSYFAELEAKAYSGEGLRKRAASVPQNARKSVPPRKRKGKREAGPCPYCGCPGPAAAPG